jgi:uncharacterized protein
LKPLSREKLAHRSGREATNRAIQRVHGVCCLRTAIIVAAMSQANIEIAKATNAALNRGDLNAVLDCFAPDAEFKDLANGPDQATVVHGTAALREVWGLWVAAFDDLRTDVEEYLDIGDSVICAAHWMGHGKTSGISVDVHQFDVYEFRDGKIVRATLGNKTKDEALRVAGHPG